MLENRNNLKLPFTDFLAEMRTLLANERTLLAYFRTSFSISIVGVTFIKILGDSSDVYIGIALNGVSLLVLVLGVMRYLKVNRVINEYKNLSYSGRVENSIEPN